MSSLFKPSQRHTKDGSPHRLTGAHPSVRRLRKASHWVYLLSQRLSLFILTSNTCIYSNIYTTHYGNLENTEKKPILRVSEFLSIGTAADDAIAARHEPRSASCILHPAPASRIEYAHWSPCMLKKQCNMTTAGLEPAAFWYREAVEAKRATIAPGSHDNSQQTHIYQLDFTMLLHTNTVLVPF